MGRFEDMQLLDGAGKLPDAFRQEYEAERAQRNAAMAPPTSAVSGAFTEPPDTLSAPDETRRVVQMAGGAAGLVSGGAAGGVPGAISGAAKGMGLAGLGYDMMTGDPDVSRNLVVGVGTTLLNFLPMTKTLRLATSTLANAAGGAAVGAGYDAATGRSITPDSVAGDAFAAGTGRLAGEALGRLDAAASANRMAGLRTRSGQAALTDFAKQEGIQLPVSAVTNSKTAARVEQYPQRKMFGAQTGLAYHLDGLHQAEESVVRHLDQIGGLNQDRSPTLLGRDLRKWFLTLKGKVNDTARKAYKVEAEAIQEPVIPGNLRSIAEQIAQEQERNPNGGVHPAVKRVLRITAKLDPETGQPAPMTWEEARMASAVLNSESYGRNPTAGNLDSGTRIRLAQAMKKDMGDVLERQTPEIQALSEFTDHSYKLTKQAIRDRVVNILNTKRAERNFANMFREGALEETQDLRQIMSRDMEGPGGDLWGRATSAWLAKVYSESGGTGRPGVRPEKDAIPKFRPSEFAKKVKPFIDSGQIDEMFPPLLGEQITPQYAQEMATRGLAGQNMPPLATRPNPTAEWIKSFAKFGESTQQAERLAQNASGTGQAMAADAQGQKLAKDLLTILKSPPMLALRTLGVGAGAGTVAGVGPMVGAAAAGIAGELAAPWAVNKLAYTRPGQALMTRLVNGPDPTATSRTLFRHFLAQTGMQGEKP